MRRLILGLAALSLGACGGSESAGSHLSGFQYDGVASTDLTGPLGTMGFNRPLHAVSGGRFFQVGGDELTTGYSLVGIDPPTTFPVRRSIALEGVRLSAVVADGGDGIFIAGNQLRTTPALYLADPVVSRWDASGAPLWSWRYESPSPSGLPAGANDSIPDVGLSEVVGDHLAVTFGRTVMAVSAKDGSIAWAVDVDVSANQQAAADATGVTVFGDADSTLFVHRFDWTGALVWARRAVGLASPQSGWVIAPPLARAGGDLIVPIDTYFGTQHRTGVVAVGADGALADVWSYTVSILMTGTYTSPTFQPEGPPLVLGQGDDALLAVTGSYVLGALTDQRPRASIVARMDAQGHPDPAALSVLGAAPARLAGDGLIALSADALAVGPLGADCSRYGLAEILTFDRSATTGFNAGVTLAAFTPTATARADFTAVAQPFTAADVAPFTVTPIAAAGCQ
jgi:hypothetical protein